MSITLSLCFLGTSIHLYLLASVSVCHDSPYQKRCYLFFANLSALVAEDNFVIQSQTWTTPPPTNAAVPRFSTTCLWPNRKSQSDTTRRYSKSTRRSRKQSNPTTAADLDIFQRSNILDFAIGGAASARPALSEVLSKEFSGTIVAHRVVGMSNRSLLIMYWVGPGA